MTNETANNRYEIAYHLTPDLDEAGVAKEVTALIDFLKQRNCAVMNSQDPKRKHLSYPINHKHYGYFGFMEFNAPRDVIGAINEHLKLQPQFFRYVVIKKPNLKEYRVLGIAKSVRPQQTVTPTMTHTPLVGQTKPVPKPQTPEQEKQMTKDIDEVLESL